VQQLHNAEYFTLLAQVIFQKVFLKLAYKLAYNENDSGD
jgi:hypothetical protein